MEKNILMWIQNENSEEFDYMFYGNQLLKEKNLKEVKIIRNILFNNPKTKKVWKADEYSQSSVLKIKNNYIITGVLKSTDSNDRRLPFMFYLPLKTDNLEDTIFKNLKVVGKEIDADLLKKLFSKAKSDNKKKKIIIGSLLLTLIIILYKILK